MAFLASSPFDSRDGFFMAPCVCCGTGQHRITYSIDKAYAAKVSGIDLNEQEIGVAICIACGHESIQPVPPPSFLGAFYSNYMSQAKTAFYKERAAVHISTSFGDRYLPWLNEIASLSHGGKRLLDVGTGLGMFLRLARDHGFWVHGVEPNPEAACRLKEHHGIEVTQGLFENVLLEERFDAVTMWDLLEHIANPRQALEKAFELLRKDGVLALEIPARDSLLHNFARILYRLSGGRIRRPLNLVCGIHHLHYFSQAEIAQLLETCGFHVRKVLRGETDLASLYRRRGGKYRITDAVYNACLAGLFWLARLSRAQNKLIIFAQKAYA